jgi:hypothetical protein
MGNLEDPIMEVTLNHYNTIPKNMGFFRKMKSHKQIKLLCELFKSDII